MRQDEDDIRTRDRLINPILGPKHNVFLGVQNI
jgi:hypothetical protein